MQKLNPLHILVSDFDVVEFIMLTFVIEEMIDISSDGCFL